MVMFSLAEAAVAVSLCTFFTDMLHMDCLHDALLC
jgi:hypothetical protein